MLRSAANYYVTGDEIKWYVSVFPGARATLYAKPMQLQHITM